MPSKVVSAPKGNNWIREKQSAVMELDRLKSKVCWGFLVIYFPHVLPFPFVSDILCKMLTEEGSR